jgi:nucleoside-diphosphate-sugar epimerase
MRILILGGTAWLGGYLAEAAHAAGHDVTCLARGTSGPAPRGARLVRADRGQPGAYDEVMHQRWDSVIDLSRQPGQVRSATAALAEACSTFIFISSTNVYADHQALDQDESAALLPPLQSEVMASMAQYGQAKVACEQIVRDAAGADRSLILRVGLIGGPGDEFDRSGYWPLRFARAARSGRRVLVPDVPQLATQVIDVRDLAAWIIDCARRGGVGIFNATGETRSFEAHMEVARRVAGYRGAVVPASSQWLLSQGVAPWMGPKSLPLWLPAADYAGFCARSSQAAIGAGLSRRALGATLEDTLNWDLRRTPPPAARRAGLSDDEEEFLIAALDPQGIQSARPQ